MGLEQRMGFGLPKAQSEAGQEKFSGFSAKIEQMTTRGNGIVEKTATFRKENIDFGASIDHLRIHREGVVAGSQFNGKLFENPQDLQKLLLKLLPEEINYDQYSRAELTLDISKPDNDPVGYSGVKSVEEIKALFPEADFKVESRIPGGMEDEEQGVKGAWYPEMRRNSETGQFEVIKDEDGNIQNPKGKFEPMANIAYVSKDQFEQVSKTNKVTLIIQKDNQTGKPTILTIFSGENAPAFPVIIKSGEEDVVNTLRDSKEQKFWEKYAFLKAI